MSNERWQLLKKMLVISTNLTNLESAPDIPLFLDIF